MLYRSDSNNLAQPPRKKTPVARLFTTGCMSSSFAATWIRSIVLHGGSLATAGGLVFIGATTDKFFRAFDAKTGEEVWSKRIPFTGSAKPMTYRLNQHGRQFVVLAAGGHGWSEPGDAVIAYALP